MAGRDRRRGALSEEDRQLWSAVKRSVTPLRPEREPPPPPAPAGVADTPFPSVPGSAGGAMPLAAPKMPDKPKAPALPALHPVARKTRQKIARGAHPIDGRLDLHGLTQAEAHGRLVGFLGAAHARGDRVVLVITGKGGTPSPGFQGLHLPERGVLRRMVPQWLALPDLRRYVHGFEWAHVGHGGEGALYVMLRRRR